MSGILESATPFVLALTAITHDLLAVRRHRLRLNAMERLARTAGQPVTVIDRQSDGAVLQLTVGDRTNESGLSPDADAVLGGPA
jgi:hypothetical protein